MARLQRGPGRYTPALIRRGFDLQGLLIERECARDWGWLRESLQWSMPGGSNGRRIYPSFSMRSRCFRRSSAYFWRAKVRNGWRPPCGKVKYSPAPDRRQLVPVPDERDGGARSERLAGQLLTGLIRLLFRTVRLPVVVIAAARSGDIVEIAFQDTGEGIAQDNLDKIFLPFFTTKKEGSGLGLAAVHRIVDLHGGWIKVESQPQRGTRFVVCLPRSGGDGVRLWHEGRTPWKRS